MQNFIQNLDGKEYDTPNKTFAEMQIISYIDAESPIIVLGALCSLQVQACALDNTNKGTWNMYVFTCEVTWQRIAGRGSLANHGAKNFRWRF